MPLTEGNIQVILGGTKEFFIMTSEERKEARYQRRVAKRIKKKKELNEKYGNFDEIISFDNLCDAFYQCKKTVSWKASTQKYERNLFKMFTKLEKIFMLVKVFLKDSIILH